jgi:cytoskeletal protein CcmA (bactofilin family)
MLSHTRNRQIFVAVLVTILAVSLVPGTALAQSGIGGTTTIESGETVSGISGVYGTIIVEGTVTGDVSGLAGDIVVSDGGVIEGNLDAAAGTIRISGTVRGDVSSGTGSISVTETGVVEGNFDVGAGTVRIDGRIDGDATIGADTIRLGDGATLAGSLTYDGDLRGNQAAVAGDITRDRSLGVSLFSDIQPFASWLFTISTFVFNLAVGALLLGLFPRFSERVADSVRTAPLRSGLVGLGTLLGVPVLLIAIAITVVGIPVSLVGLFAFLVVLWIGLVYGRFAVGVWALSFFDIENRWAGLVVGLVLASVLWRLPLVGGPLNALIFLLGLGALVTAVVGRRRRLGDSERE